MKSLNTLMVEDSSDPLYYFFNLYFFIYFISYLKNMLNIVKKIINNINKLIIIIF